MTENGKRDSGQSPVPDWALAPFEERPVCRKCRSTKARVTYGWPARNDVGDVETPEQLAWRCSRCGYTWETETADAELQRASRQGPR